MKSIIIGTTDLANQLYFKIKKYTTINVVAFSVNKDYIQCNSFLGLPVVELETLEQCYPPAEYNIYIAIGYTQMNQTRQKIYENLKPKGYEFPNFIYPTAITDYETIGEANIILANTMLDCFVRIGNGNIVCQYSTIGHNSVIGDFNFFAPYVCIGGHSQIGNLSFFGTHAIVKSGVRVGNKTMLGASVYLNKNCVENSVIVPAQPTFINRPGLEVKL